MASLINSLPQTWYEAKWPYPKAKLIRENAKLEDREGRFYCRCLHKTKTNGTTLIKNLVVGCIKNSQHAPLQMRSKVVFKNGTCKIVTDIGLDFYPRRCIGVVSFHAKIKRISRLPVIHDWRKPDINRFFRMLFASPEHAFCAPSSN